ncbi:MAG TPA: AraC family transcriptional regulator [Rhodocyclaceae bacterium]|nr:AraC family transcriptional regulator [Rhodocyclaceae bacterium]
MNPDGISRLLEHVGLHANTFYAGSLCGLHRFGADEGVGHLHVIRSGQLRASRAGGRAVLVREPSLLFYPRPLDHRLDAGGSIAADVLCASIRYDAGLENAITQSLPEVVIIPFSAVPRLDSTLTALFAEAETNQAGRQVMLDRLCDILLIHIVRYAIDTRLVSRGILAGLAHARLAGLLGGLLDDPRRPWSLEAMAARAGLSRNGFARTFREVVGITPGQFLARVRIALAQRLLRRGRPLPLVAEEVGYGSQPAFSRAFIRELGVSPSGWLRAQKTL